MKICYVVTVLHLYDSDENLQNDHHLISLMDDLGWVPVSTIAEFKRVCIQTCSTLCNDNLILFKAFLAVCYSIQYCM